MKRQIGRCILPFVLGLALGGPASAQGIWPYGNYAPTLPPQEIMALVRSTGLEPLGRPQRQAQGTSYTLRAMNRSGQEVRVTVDARAGRIVKVAPVSQDAAAGAPARAPGAGVSDGYGPNSRLGSVPAPPPNAAGPKVDQGTTVASGDAKLQLRESPLTPSDPAPEPFEE